MLFYEVVIVLPSVKLFRHSVQSLCRKCNVFFSFCCNSHSNTPRLYSQWLNSVIYWLIYHCTDWARTGVTSFGRQFDFHDVICQIRRRSVTSILQLLDVKNVRKNTSFSLNKSCGIF